MAGDKSKNKVSDDILRMMMRDLLAKGETGATHFYDLLRTKIQLEKARCLKLYPIVEAEWVEFKNNIIDKARAEAISNATKEGLKTDLELELILCSIASQDIEVEEWVRGEAVLRSVSPGEIVAAVKTLFQKRGSNAPTKNQISFTKVGSEAEEEKYNEG